LFEKFSTSIHWLVDYKVERAGCVHVLDEFLFVGPPNSDLCHQTLFRSPVNNNILLLENQSNLVTSDFHFYRIKKKKMISVVGNTVFSSLIGMPI
jgi:hypothetical protein